MKTVADAMGVSRSNLAERLKGKSKPRGLYRKTEDAEVLPAIRRLVDARPTYGYRRIAEGSPPASAAIHGMTLSRTCQDQIKNNRSLRGFWKYSRKHYNMFYPFRTKSNDWQDEDAFFVEKCEKATREASSMP